MESIRNIILRAIASPDFVFRFDDVLDAYWASLATSTKPWVRDALEHVGDGRIAPCVFSLLVSRWAGEPVWLLKMVCRNLVSNLVFSAILMSVGAHRGRIRNSGDVKSVADNFEAYCAAYARQFGTRRLKSWVFRAFGPLVDTIRPSCTTTILPQVIACPRPNRVPVKTTMAPMAQTAILVQPAYDAALAAPIPVDVPVKPAKRRCSDENDEPLPKRAKLKKSTAVVLGDRTNGQTAHSRRGAGKQASRRVKQNASDAPTLLQRMSDPLAKLQHLGSEAPPALLERMESSAMFIIPPERFSDGPASYQAHNAVSAASSSENVAPCPESPPVLLRRMETPSPFVGYRSTVVPPKIPTNCTPYPPFSSSSHMPRWASSGIFASAMQEIGLPTCTPVHPPKSPSTIGE
ncbi:hypothetical protein C8R43DRAFT_1001901 [Mycena crocata]|nr:hypothetical protein C8R43DRAFT_1001901 [Mycena crocata]